jgi:hypothetical protein
MQGINGGLQCIDIDPSLAYFAVDLYGLHEFEHCNLAGDCHDRLDPLNMGPWSIFQKFGLLKLILLKYLDPLKQFWTPEQIQLKFNLY